jgi:hypothetical protein
MIVCKGRAWVKMRDIREIRGNEGKEERRKCIE